MAANYYRDKLGFQDVTPGQWPFESRATLESRRQDVESVLWVDNVDAIYAEMQASGAIIDYGLEV